MSDNRGRYHTQDGRYRADLPTDPKCIRCGERPPAANGLCGPCLAQDIVDLKAQLVAAQTALEAATGQSSVPHPYILPDLQPTDPPPETLGRKVARWLRFE